MGAGAGGAVRAVSVWEIAADPSSPGALLLRDEQGAARFSSSDGGRTWLRSPAAVVVADTSATERRDASTHEREASRRCA